MSTEKYVEIIGKWRDKSPAEFALQVAIHPCFACKWFSVDWEEQIVFCRLFNIPLDQAGETCGCYRPLKTKKCLGLLIKHAIKLLSE